MKRLFILIALFAIAVSAKAQLKLSNTGNLSTRGAFFVDAYNVVNWDKAIYAKVYTQYACSYNLWNASSRYNKDVFFVCGEGYLWTLKGGYFGSDIRLKKNTMPIEKALEKVLNLNGVQFQYIEGVEEEGIADSEGFRLGFIAQEVEKIFPEVVKDMPDGTKAMSYTDLTAVLVEAVKEQQKEIEILREKVKYLESADITNPVNKKPSEEKTTEAAQKFYYTETTVNTREMKVFQNAPNPFNETTTIKCFIPENITKAQLCIYDMRGIQVKCLDISERNYVTVQIQAGQLSAGIYTYIIIGDAKTSEAKQMILTN
jgi:hypothetical protein